jgi:hypothetical protein
MDRLLRFGDLQRPLSTKVVFCTELCMPLGQVVGAKAPAYRAEVSTGMTSKQIALAQKMATKCIQSGLKNCGD